jgi:uncharacterized protein
MSRPQSAAQLLSTSLSDVELDELDRFLMSDVCSDETMVLDTLDGYLTAVIIGPVTVLPSQWWPRIWGPSDEDAPVFKTAEQARRVHELVLRHMNGIIWTLQDDPDSFEPMMCIARLGKPPREYLDGEMWAHGFMQGVNLSRTAWQPLFKAPDGRNALRPLRLLGADDIGRDQERLTRTPKQREKLAMQVPASIAAIYRFWLPYRKAAHEKARSVAPARTQSKPGRNDPCPCGSGKKFKKCCGAGQTIH